jgi:hypothetical protein
MIHYLSPRKISGFQSESAVLQWPTQLTVTGLSNYVKKIIGKRLQLFGHFMTFHEKGLAHFYPRRWMTGRPTGGSTEAFHYRSTAVPSTGGISI